MNRVTLCLLTLVALGSCLKLPSSFKKCDRKRIDFNQCLSDAIHGALKILDKPLPSYGLPSLYDVTLPEVISFGNRTYGLLQNYDHLKLIGLSKPTNINAKMDFGPVTSTLTIEASYSQLTYLADCEFQGTIVLLPVNVQTLAEFTFVDPTFTFSFELEEYEKGTTHFRVINSKLERQIRDFKFDFKQLFSNKILNEEFNNAMDAKGEQIFALFKDIDQAMFSPLFGRMFNAFLEKVPVDELFD
ncbi:hypothetical protein Zmor_018826 [Zophobas morio]|uniref:Protein takeout n=1 Tax=Zophobas morio TaxID=2755281 RepID=A0AA38IC20_9CUCU|nr:hypothetical protein Zmor_018826 [Zophobas morio]